MKYHITLFQGAKTDREPSQIYTFTGNSIIKVAYFAVGDWLNPNWKMGWFAYQLLFCIIFSGFCYLFHGYVNRADLKEVIITACLVMFPTIGLQRVHLIVANHETGLTCMKYIEEFTRKWEKTEVGHPILLWYLRVLKFLVIYGLGGFCCFGALMMTGPFILYLLTGKMIVIVELYLPLLDYKTHPGFELHLLFHFICIFYVICGIGSLTFQILTLFISLCSQIDILTARITILKESIDKNGKTWQKSKTKKSDPELTKTLRDIYEDHQTMVEFLDYLEDLLSHQQLMDHSIFGFQICTALFIVMQEVWIPGYYVVVAGMFIVFTIDSLGTIIQVKLENLSAAVYDVPWYMIAIRDQKNFCYFLAHTQNCERLTLYGRLPLNLDTFVRFLKGIYSYLMILREVEL